MCGYQCDKSVTKNYTCEVIWYHFTSVKWYHITSRFELSNQIDCNFVRLDGWCPVDKECFKMLSREWWFCVNGWCLCINPLNNCGHVCCVVEVNFLISCPFSSPAPAPTLQSLLSHSLNISHVTESTTEAKVTETSPVTQPNSTAWSTDTITEGTSNRTVKRKEYQIADWGTSGIVAFVVALMSVTIIGRFLMPLFLHQIKKVCLISAVSGNLKLKCGDSIARV